MRGRGSNGKFTHQSPYDPTTLADRLRDAEDRLAELEARVASLSGTQHPEPFCTLATAAELLGIRDAAAVSQWLKDHKELFPEVCYIVVGRERRRYRVLYASEIELIKRHRWRFWRRGVDGKLAPMFHEPRKLSAAAKRGRDATTS